MPREDIRHEVTITRDGENTTMRLYANGDVSFSSCGGESFIYFYADQLRTVRGFIADAIPPASIREEKVYIKPRDSWAVPEQFLEPEE